MRKSLPCSQLAILSSMPLQGRNREGTEFLPCYDHGDGELNVCVAPSGFNVMCVNNANDTVSTASHHVPVLPA